MFLMLIFICRASVARGVWFYVVSLNLFPLSFSRRSQLSPFVFCIIHNHLYLQVLKFGGANLPKDIGVGCGWACTDQSGAPTWFIILWERVDGKRKKKVLMRMKFPPALCRLDVSDLLVLTDLGSVPSIVLGLDFFFSPPEYPYITVMLSRIPDDWHVVRLYLHLLILEN